VEYGSKGVNCVAIHPGGVLTELSKNIEEIRDSKFAISHFVLKSRNDAYPDIQN